MFSKFMNFSRVYRLELIAIADGIIVMMMELVGSRYVAPYLGTSTYVWTAIIGVILGALAVGNYYGGRLADKRADTTVLTRIILIAATILLANLALQPLILEAVASFPVDLRIKALLASLFLFAAPAVFMGMLAPYLAKLRLTDLQHAGQSVGTLYAAGTLGSIIGTFATGYFLIGTFGSRTLGWSLVVALVLVSFAVDRRLHMPYRIALIGVTVLLALTIPAFGRDNNMKLVYDTDSSYGRYQVYDSTSRANSFGQARTVRYLVTDDQGLQSGIDIAKPTDLIFEYAKRFAEAADAYPGKPARILMIGGGSLTVPYSLAQRYPDTTIDVVEIDPKLTKISEDYFQYKPMPNVHIINQEGRYFLNNNKTKYDIIYMDAFTSLSPPFQLSTSQAAVRLADGLVANGIIVVNLVATPEASRPGFAAASYATYASQFKYVGWQQGSMGIPLNVRQNMILIASQDKPTLDTVTSGVFGPELPAPDYTSANVLTDDFAPVERLTNQN